MQVTDAPTRKPLPYYGTYVLFARLMVYLKENGIPRWMDKRSLAKGVGEDASRIVSGFSALNWIDEGGAASPDFRALVEAFGTDSWRETFRNVLVKTYTFLPGDWSELSPAKLHDAFVDFTRRDIGAVRSAETFFLVAATEAGIVLSPAFLNRTATAGPRIVHKRRPLFDGKSEDDSVSSHDSASVAQPPSQNVAKDQIWDQLLSLIDDPEMTDKEKVSLMTILSYLRRKAKAGKKQNAA